MAYVLRYTMTVIANINTIQHIVGSECITTWLGPNGNNSCPCCRRAVFKDATVLIEPDELVFSGILGEPDLYNDGEA